MRPHWKGERVIATPDDERTPDEIRALMAEIEADKLPQKFRRDPAYRTIKSIKKRAKRVKREASGPPTTPPRAHPAPARPAGSELGDQES